MLSISIILPKTTATPKNTPEVAYAPSKDKAANKSRDATNISGLSTIYLGLDYLPSHYIIADSAQMSTLELPKREVKTD